MFVTLSCSGFPDQSTCTFTPENVEIQPSATAAVTSDMVVSTQAKPTHGALSTKNNGMALAILIPGAAGLIGLAAFARKGGWARLTLIALVALVTSLGMTACNPRYNYFNHGPPYNLPTPAGTYQMLVTAQSSNGVTATTHSADVCADGEGAELRLLGFKPIRSGEEKAAQCAAFFVCGIIMALMRHATI